MGQKVILQENAFVQQRDPPKVKESALMSKRPQQLLWYELDERSTNIKVVKIKKRQLTSTVTFAQLKRHHKTYAF